MYETQRQDFDIWASMHKRDLYHGSPKLQRDPLSRIAQMGQRIAPVVYEQGTPEELTRQDREEAYNAVQAVMSRLKEIDTEAHNCLMARHAGIYRDAQGVTWHREGRPEHSVAVAMFGGNFEGSRKRFNRACIRGYIAYNESYCGC